MLYFSQIESDPKGEEQNHFTGDEQQFHSNEKLPKASEKWRIYDFGDGGGEVGVNHKRGPPTYYLVKISRKLRGK